MFNFKKMRYCESDVYVFEFNPVEHPSQVSFGVKNKLEPISNINHKWYMDNGYHEIAKVNLGFFWDKTEHLGLVIYDGGFMEGNPQSVNGVECYLTKGDFRFVVEQMTMDKAKQIYKDVFWGGSLSYALVINGKENTLASEYYSHFNSREPRTLIGQKADKTMVIAVADGRTVNSKGLTGKQSASLMLELGCLNGINADGGGSSSLEIRTPKGMELVNKPSDGKERAVGTALIVFSKKDVVSTPQPSKPETQPTVKKVGKKIALDAGHGSDTFAKTGGKGVKYDGGKTFEEHTFNAAVVKITQELLESRGFDVILTQPLNKPDVPLKTRTDLANKEKADLFVSFHADASTSTTVKGHTVFHWHNSNSGLKVSQIWDKYANQIMKNPCRGVIKSIPGTWTDFHVVRETNMVAILCEHAFFTNPEERSLLLTSDFQHKCAEVMARTICEYYGVKY